MARLLLDLGQLSLDLSAVPAKLTKFPSKKYSVLADEEKGGLPPGTINPVKSFIRKDFTQNLRSSTRLIST